MSKENCIDSLSNNVGETATPDFYVLGGGSVYLLQPNTHAAHDWIGEHIPEDAQTLGESIAVEHRYIWDIIEGARADDLTVEKAG